MITQKTAEMIYNAHREIKVAEELLTEMQEKLAHMPDKNSATLKDAFGQVQHLQLGIPSGPNSSRLYNVRPSLAESVIRAHIADCQTRLVEANERARIELSNP